VFSAMGSAPRTPLLLLLLFSGAWPGSEAGHCYGIAGESACTGNVQGSPCAYCNGRCQMASDACAVQISQDQLSGSPMFQDFSHLLTTNPTQKNYGVSVTDIDNDGEFEFVVAGYGSANQAFKWNRAIGKFIDIALGKTSLQDPSGMAIGLAACDVDGDGFEELYILNTDSYSGQTQTSDKLLDRDVQGTYSDMLQGANYVAGRSCVCLDRHGSGRYGVFVANYGGPMRLYELPEGGSDVQDMAAAVGMDKTTGGRALIAGPLVTNRMDVFANNEGYSGGRRLHAYGANSSSRRLSHRPNFLFTNDGNGNFNDVAAEVGLLDASQTGRGTALIDSNNDGLLDIVYGNWNGPHRLYVQERGNDNCPKFVDKAPPAMAMASPIRTVIVADFDNDGYEEIFWNNIPGANRLFRKLPTDPDWTQVKIGDALEENGYGTGAAVGDFDGDGQLELVVAHGESASQPLSYFRPNAGSDNHWLRVLPMTSQGAPARGARVSLLAGSRTQTRVIDAGSGYLCQMEPVAHFGLGNLSAVHSITVTWPDGAEHMIRNPGIDRVLRVSRPPNIVPVAFRRKCDPPMPIVAVADPAPEPTPEPAPEPAPTPVPVPKPEPTPSSTSSLMPSPSSTQAPSVAVPASSSPTPAPVPYSESTSSNPLNSQTTSTRPSMPDSSNSVTTCTKITFKSISCLVLLTVELLAAI